MSSWCEREQRDNVQAASESSPWWWKKQVSQVSPMGRAETGNKQKFLIRGIDRSLHLKSELSAERFVRDGNSIGREQRMNDKKEQGQKYGIRRTHEALPGSRRPRDYDLPQIAPAAKGPCGAKA